MLSEVWYETSTHSKISAVKEWIISYVITYHAGIKINPCQ